MMQGPGPLPLLWLRKTIVPTGGCTAKTSQMSASGKRQCGKVWRGQDRGTGHEGGLGPQSFPLQCDELQKKSCWL